MNSNDTAGSESTKAEFSQNEIKVGTIISTKNTKKGNGLFVYEIQQSKKGKLLFNCIKAIQYTIRPPTSLLPGFLYRNRIISYGSPTQITVGQIEAVISQVDPSKAEQIANHQKHYLAHNHIRPAVKTASGTKVPGYRPAKVKSTGSSFTPSAEKYSVTDKIVSGSDGVCPACRSRIYSKQYNVPAYDEKGNFHSYYAAILFHCPQCHNYFISDKDFHDLVSRVNSSSSRNHVAPQNMTRRYDNISHSYLYAPIATELSLFRGTQSGTGKKSDVQTRSDSVELTTLNDSSFLADMGYSTSLSKNERQGILDEAIRQFGRRKTADHIRFLIRMREAQSGGSVRYAFAISVWQDDLNYISSGRT